MITVFVSIIKHFCQTVDKIHKSKPEKVNNDTYYFFFYPRKIKNKKKELEKKIVIQIEKLFRADFTK